MRDEEIAETRVLEDRHPIFFWIICPSNHVLSRYKEKVGIVTPLFDHEIINETLLKSKKRNICISVYTRGGKISFSLPKKNLFKDNPCHIFLEITNDITFISRTIGDKTVTLGNRKMINFSEISENDILVINDRSYFLRQVYPKGMDDDFDYYKLVKATLLRKIIRCLPD